MEGEEEEVPIEPAAAEPADGEEVIGVDPGSLFPALASALYGGDWRVTLRELIQNAHDAIVELQMAAPELRRVWRIDIIPNIDEQTLEVRDNGIGMSLPEVRTKLAMVGVQRKRVQAYATLRNEIGQFGIGFLSSFIVASEVEVLTQSYELKENPVHALFKSCHRWTHKGGENMQPGTSVVLHIKPECATKVLEFDKLKKVVRKFAEILPFPIFVHRGPHDQDGEVANHMQPPWEVPEDEEVDPDVLKHYILSRFLPPAEDSEESDPLLMRAFEVETNDGVTARGFVFVPRKVQQLSLGGLENLLGLPAGLSRGKPKMRVYCQRMFVKNLGESLLHPWIRSICYGMLDTPSLSPVLSRNDVNRDDAFEKLKQALNVKLARILAEAARDDKVGFQQVAKTHRDTLIGGMLMEWKEAPNKQEHLTRQLLPHFPFHALIGGNRELTFVSLEEYSKILKKTYPHLCEDGKRHVYFVKSNVDSSVRDTILDRGFPVIVVRSSIEKKLVKLYGNVADNVKIEKATEVVETYLSVTDEERERYQHMERVLATSSIPPTDVLVASFSPREIPMTAKVSGKMQMPDLPPGDGLLGMLSLLSMLQDSGKNESVVVRINTQNESIQAVQAILVDEEHESAEKEMAKNILRALYLISVGLASEPKHVQMYAALHRWHEELMTQSFGTVDSQSQKHEVEAMRRQLRGKESELQTSEASQERMRAELDSLKREVENQKQTNQQVTAANEQLTKTIQVLGANQGSRCNCVVQ